MPVELKVPEVGESITEVQIGQWLKQPGDTVAKDEPIVEIETDKVTLELPAPVTGTITEVGKAQGDEATVGDVIGMMEEGEVEVAAAASKAAQPAAAEKESSADKETAGGNGESAAPAASKPDDASSAAQAAPSEAYIMPAARRLLEQHQLDPAAIEATGPGGRLLKQDVEAYLADQAREAAPAAEPQKAPPQPAPASPAPAVAAPAYSAPDEERGEEAVPMTPLRRRIAERLVQAQQTGALLTTFNECDMTAVMALRNRYKEQFQEKHGIKLGFMSFFVKAAVEALKEFPAVNAEIRDTEIVYKNYYDIGIAIGGGKGLVVPVLRNTERMSFADVEKSIASYAAKAKDNKIELSDLQGGTFTITNGGIYGSMMSTPIINPPQSGVLGMHAIQKRPIVITNDKGEDELAIRPMMYLALTYDHRLVDGREAVTFLLRVKAAIEDPSRLLLEA